MLRLGAGTTIKTITRRVEDAVVVAREIYTGRGDRGRVNE